MGVFMCMRMSMRVFMLRIMKLMRVFVAVADLAVGICIFAVDDNVDLGPAQATASDLAHRKVRAEIQGRSGFFEEGEGHAGIDQGAEQHISTDTGKTVQIGNSHREKLYGSRQHPLSPGV